MPSDLALLCRTLCEIPSVTGGEARLAAEVEGRFRSGRFEVERHGNSVLARGPQRGRPLVALVGHSDTVPPSAKDQGVRIEGGRIYARGASDMKSGLAVMVALANDLDLDALPYDLAFIVYAREEGPVLDNELGPLLRDVSWLHDIALAFVLEPSDNIAQVGAMGTLHATLSFQGKAAHSARPWQGENAIHKAGPVLEALAARAPLDVDVDGFRFKEVMSATLAQGGLARNVIPDRFDLNVNYRFSPLRTLEEAQREVKRLAGDRASVTFTDLAPSGKVIDRTNTLYATFLDRTGVSVAAKQAWTDVSQLTRAGIDAVNFGPGNAAQAHQAGEFVDIALMEDGYRLFRLFLEAP